jgi:hypothetical protein
VEDVTATYTEQVRALMDTVKQMDSALLRRSKMRTAGTGTGPSTASGTAGNMSDLEKIYLQISLDIDAYGREVQQLGIDPLSVRSFRELKELQAEVAAAQVNAAHQT